MPFSFGILKKEEGEEIETRTGVTETSTDINTSSNNAISRAKETPVDTNSMRSETSGFLSAFNKISPSLGSGNKVQTNSLAQKILKPDATKDKKKGNDPPVKVTSKNGGESMLQTTATSAPNGKTGTSDKSSVTVGIESPHDHDVLSGRGNSVNHHPGNEYFRSLVRHHKLAYVSCPKPQKVQYSKMIVSTIRDRDPPGRFLKQNPTSKLWYDIGTQQALDKTRQALREGAPATVAGLMVSHGLPPTRNPGGEVPGETGAGGGHENDVNKGNHYPHHRPHHPDTHSHAHAAAMAAVARNQMVGPYYNAAAASGGPGVSPTPNFVSSLSSLNPPSSSNSNNNNKTLSTVSGTDEQSSNDKMVPTSNHKAAHDNKALKSPAGPSPLEQRSSVASNFPSQPTHDEMMKFHAAQFVKMAAANQTNNNLSKNNNKSEKSSMNHHSKNCNNGGSGGGSNGSNHPNPTAFPNAATMNQGLLEQIMASQHQFRSNNFIASSSGHGNHNNYSVFGNPPPITGQADSYLHQNQNLNKDAYIQYLLDKIQQRERQLLTLCSHILLSSPQQPGNNNGTIGSSMGGPQHGGISHPQFTATAKMNAAAIVANINATSYEAAAVNKGIHSRMNPYEHHQQLTTSTASSGGNTNSSNYTHVINGNTPGQPALPDPFVKTHSPSLTGTLLHSKNDNTSNASIINAPPKTKSNSSKTKKETTPNNAGDTKKDDKTNGSGKPNDDGDAVAALLSLGIGQSSSSESNSPLANILGSERGSGSQSPSVGTIGYDESLPGEKKRKGAKGGRKKTPSKKKQKKQQNNNNSTQLISQQQLQQQLSGEEQNQHEDQQQLQFAQGHEIFLALKDKGYIPQDTPPTVMNLAPESYLYGDTPVYEPHIHDVLCGRGALTNEHPGNEWFRRLVRSNRQLYRSCPKHTKLLVAKAIVQAVQRNHRNPPGRFLEKMKNEDGSIAEAWIPISYKSAVEKASQALREKVTPNWGAPPSYFPLSKALEAAKAVAYLEKEYPSGESFGSTNLLALIMAVVQSAGLE